MSEPVFYEIHINEYQRALIERCLRKVADLVMPELQTEPGDGAFDTAGEEFEVLIEMLTDLPRIEAEHRAEYPNGGRLTHGLCL